MIQHVISHFLIIANGPFDYDATQFFAKDHTIIAVDGGSNYLQEITPHYVLGDFDSINSDLKKKYEHLSIHTPDQEKSDLEKALDFAKSKNATKIVVLAALGGDRLDHHIGNLSLLKQYYDKDCPIFLMSNKQTVLFLKDETVEIAVPINEHCGFVGFPKAKVTTVGLKWDVQDWETELGNKVSISNLTNSSALKVTVQGELLLIYPK